MAIYLIPSQLMRRRAAVQVFGHLYCRAADDIRDRLHRGLPNASSAQLVAASTAVCRHLCQSIERHLFSDDTPGVDYEKLARSETVDAWITAAITDAIAAAGCP